MDLRSELIEHLKFLEELGANGVSRDPAWRARPSTSSGGAEPVDTRDGISAPSGGPAQHSGRDEVVSAFAARSERAAAPVEVSMFDQVPIPAARSAGEALEMLRRHIGDCTRCALHRNRTTLVFGVGNPQAELMFVGEAPGHEEDVQGIPFVGRAGQLLTKIIESIGLARDDVYIANVVKCRPPENRNPEPDEIHTCEPFLFAQVDAIKPRVIVALGSFAVKTLLRSEDPISRVRGRVYDYRGAKLVPTFHPAFLLRSPDRKRDVWEDMKKVRALLSGE